MAQGRDAAKELLKRDAGIYGEIETAVLESLNGTNGKDEK